MTEHFYRGLVQATSAASVYSSCYSSGEMGILPISVFLLFMELDILKPNLIIINVFLYYLGSLWLKTDQRGIDHYGE